MAKAKKKAVLTIEERLEQALVPEDEQPYPVPGNWLTFYFTSLIDVQGGTQPPKSCFSEKKLNGYVRLVQIRDFASDKYTVYVSNTPNLRHFEEKDILIARYGASLGRICTGLSGVYNVALAKTIFSNKILNNRFVYWLLQSESFQFPLMQISRTAQAGFNKEDLSQFAMPLPPLSEQQRIVDRIESLFAKLDEAKEKAQAALDSFETRKAAILHNAFTGELTAKWREENGVRIDSWKYKKFENCIDIMQNGLSKRSGKEGSKYLVLRLANLSNSDFITDDMRYIILDEKEQLLYKLHINDVVMIRVNGSKENVGRQLLVNSENEWAFCDHLIRIKYNENIVLPQYIVYFSKSDRYRQYIRENMVSSAGQNTISRKGMAQLKVPHPDISEQYEIVRILDNFFTKEQKAKELCSVLDKIDLIKKSILARAFRGELGTNDPAEENALELLKNIV